MEKTSAERKERTNWDYFLEGCVMAYDLDAVWNPKDNIRSAWESVGENMYKAMAQIDRELKSQSECCNENSK